MLRYIFIYGKFVLLLILFLGFSSCRKQKKTVRTDLVHHEEKPPVQPPKPVVTEYIVKVEASNSYAEQLEAEVEYFDENEKIQKKIFFDKIDFNAAKEALEDDEFNKARDQLKSLFSGSNSLFPGFDFSSLFGGSADNKKDEKKEEKKEEKKLLYQDTFFVTKQIRLGAHMESQKLEAEATNLKPSAKKTQVDDNKVFLRVSILDKNGAVIKKQELTGKSAYSTKEKPNIITIVVP